MIGEDKVGCPSCDLSHHPARSLQLFKPSGVAAGEACTVVLRGSTSQMVDEAERFIAARCAVCILADSEGDTDGTRRRTLSEMLLSCAVEGEARTVTGKKVLLASSCGIF
jgi:T-complex protein 1 subunit beta